MSNQTDQRLVLDLLETGRIDTSEADWLLDRIGSPSAGQTTARRPATPYQPERGNKVVLEIDADEDNLQMVMQKLSEAICNHRAPEQKTGFFQRFARRNRLNPTAG